MKFSIAALIGVVVSVCSVAEAVNIKGYTAYNCPSNRMWVCWNIPANACCRFRLVNIYSMSWTLPSLTRGIGYRGLICNNPQYLPVFGPRTNSCFNYTAGPVRSAKWLKGICPNGRPYRVRRELENRQETCPVEGCYDPNVVTITDTRGVVTSYDLASVPAADYATTVQSIEKGDTTILTKLKVFTGEKLDGKPVDVYTGEEGVPDQ